MDRHKSQDKAQLPCEWRWKPHRACKMKISISKNRKLLSILDPVPSILSFSFSALPRLYASVGFCWRQSSLSLALRQRSFNLTESQLNVGLTVGKGNGALFGRQGKEVNPLVDELSAQACVQLKVMIAG